MEIRLCRFCMEQIHEYHGNNWHHSECVEKDRNRRSKNRYEKQQLKLDPYWLNEKILREFYSLFGEMVEIEPVLLAEMRFDFEIWKEKLLFNEYKQFFMHQYGYSPLQNRNVILWKR